MSSKRLEELQRKLQEAEDGSEPLTEEELEEIEGGEDLSCNNDKSCTTTNPSCNVGCNTSCGTP